MTKISIQIYLYASLIIALAIGIYVLIWWYKKVSTQLNKSIKNDKSIESIGMKSIFYNLPSLIVFSLLFLPSLYFGYLLKQLTFCRDVVEFNTKNSKNFNFNSPEFIEDCGCFDINELTNK